MSVRTLKFHLSEESESLIRDAAFKDLPRIFRINNWKSDLLPNRFSWYFFDDSLFLEIFGSDLTTYSVKEDDVEFLVDFEKKLNGLDLNFVVPPSSDYRCFTIENYPEYF